MGCGFASCDPSTESPFKMEHKDQFTTDCYNSGAKPALACQLTGPELQKRKASVLASLKKQVVDKKELADGYSYKFAGTDSVMEELVNFIKTERMCCDFFEFTLKVAGDASATWLNITGPEGAKDFINTELEL